MSAAIEEHPGVDEASSDLQAFRVASFTALREEILERSRAQLQLIMLTLTAFSTIAGLVAANGGERWGNLLLLVPVVSSATALIWLDHDRRIFALSRYIYIVLWRKRPGSFIEYSETLGKDKLMRRVGFFSPIMLVFFGPAAVALAWAVFLVVCVSIVGYVIAALVVLLSAIYFFVVSRREMPDPEHNSQ